MAGHLVERTDYSLDGLGEALFDNQRWIDKLFYDFQLFPILGDDNYTIDILTKEPISSAIIRMFSKINFKDLVISLTGLDLMRRLGRGEISNSITEEAFKLLQDHVNEKNTINRRTSKRIQRADKDGMMFSFVRENISPQKSPFSNDFIGTLYSKINKLDRNFVTVSGVLCQIDKLSNISGANLSKALKSSEIKWVLADFPYFAMGQPGFHNGVVLLNMKSGITDAIRDTLPFNDAIGWYPYVRISGVCRYPHSPNYHYASITPSWIEYRTPKPFADIEHHLEEAYHPTMRPTRGFHVDKANLMEILAFIDIFRIIAKGEHLEVDDLKGNLIAYRDAVRTLTTVSSESHE